MLTYPKPNISEEYRASGSECRDRAQRALEVAELCLDTVSELMTTNGATTSDLIAHAGARVRVANGWVRLAEAKAFPDA